MTTSDRLAQLDADIKRAAFLARFGKPSERRQWHHLRMVYSDRRALLLRNARAISPPRSHATARSGQDLPDLIA